MSSRRIPPKIPLARTARTTWTLPILLNAAGALGLGAALVGDGVWDVISWIALGVLLAPVARAIMAVRTTQNDDVSRPRQLTS